MRLFDISERGKMLVLAVVMISMASYFARYR